MRHYGRVVKATDSNFDYLFRSPSAGSNPAGVVFVCSQRISARFFLGGHNVFPFRALGAQVYSSRGFPITAGNWMFSIVEKAEEKGRKSLCS